MIKAQKRATGSFYTCFSIADYIVRWAISSEDTKVLESSFGDGSFLYSALNRFEQLGNTTLKSMVLSYRKSHSTALPKIMTPLYVLLRTLWTTIRIRDLML